MNAHWLLNHCYEDRRYRLHVSTIDYTETHFYVRSIGESSREEYPYFWIYLNFLLTQCRMGGNVELENFSCHCYEDRYLLQRQAGLQSVIMPHVTVHYCRNYCR